MTMGMSERKSADVLHKRTQPLRQIKRMRRIDLRDILTPIKMRINDVKSNVKADC